MSSRDPAILFDGETPSRRAAKMAALRYFVILLSYYPVKRRTPIILALAIALHFAVSLWLAYGKYARLCNVNPLAVFENALWHTLHGRFMHSGLYGINMLGDHASPFFLVALPLYALAPHAVTLLAVRCAAMSLGAIPVFLLAHKLLGGELAPLLLALAYLAYPPLNGINIEGFAPVSFAVPIALATLCLHAYGRKRWFWAALVLCLTIKENVSLAFFCFGLGLIVRRDWRLGGAVCALCALWFAAAVGWVIPHFRGETFAEHRLATRYAPEIGRSFPEMVTTIVTRPGFVVRYATAPGKRLYLMWLLGPLLFLPVLGPTMSLGALPTLVQNLLSRDPTQNTILSHYHALFIPFAFVGAIYGLRRVARGRGRAWLAGAVLAASAASLASSDVARYFLRDDAAVAFLTTHELPADRVAAAQELIARIPADASVAASINLVHHIARRADVSYELFAERALDHPGPDYALIDFELPLLERVWDAGPRVQRLAQTLNERYHVVAKRLNLALLARGRRLGPRPMDERNVAAMLAATERLALERYVRQPYSPAAARNLGLLLANTGRKAEAYTVFEHGRRIAPMDKALRVHLAHCWMDLGNAHRARSEAIVRRQESNRTETCPAHSCETTCDGPRPRRGWWPWSRSSSSTVSPAPPRP